MEVILGDVPMLIVMVVSAAPIAVLAVVAFALLLIVGNKGDGRTPLNWEMRPSIALGAARGVFYHYSQGSSTFHGNIESSNILLTKSNKACVFYFELASPNCMASYPAKKKECAMFFKILQKRILIVSAIRLFYC